MKTRIALLLCIISALVFGGFSVGVSVALRSSICGHVAPPPFAASSDRLRLNSVAMLDYDTGAKLLALKCDRRGICRDHQGNLAPSLLLGEGPALAAMRFRPAAPELLAQTDPVLKPDPTDADAEAAGAEAAKDLAAGQWGALLGPVLTLAIWGLRKLKIGWLEAHPMILQSVPFVLAAAVSIGKAVITGGDIKSVAISALTAAFTSIVTFVVLKNAKEQAAIASGKVQTVGDAAAVFASKGPNA